MEDASSKYLVGQLISAMICRCQMIWASIWLSKMKSSEFSSSGRRSSNSREKARYPVWYSDSLAPISRFENAVSRRLEMYFHPGIPPASEYPPRIRDPSTHGYRPLPIKDAMAGINWGVYW